MSIYVACSCGQAFAAPPSFAGKTVPCPFCAQQLIVPSLETAVRVPKHVVEKALAESSAASSVLGSSMGSDSSDFGSELSSLADTSLLGDPLPAQSPANLPTNSSGSKTLDENKLLLYAGSAGGAAVLILIVAVLISRSGNKPTTVAANDPAKNSVAATPVASKAAATPIVQPAVPPAIPTSVVPAAVIPPAEVPMGAPNSPATPVPPSATPSSAIPAAPMEIVPPSEGTLPPGTVPSPDNLSVPPMVPPAEPMPSVPVSIPPGVVVPGLGSIPMPPAEPPPGTIPPMEASLTPPMSPPASIADPTEFPLPANGKIAITADQRFELWLPGEAEPTTTQEKYGEVMLPVRRFKAKGEKGTAYFFMEFTATAEHDAKAIQELYWKSLKANVVEKKGRITAEGSLKFADHSAEELIFLVKVFDAAKKSRTVAIFEGRQVFVLAAYGNPPALESEEADSFFRSFREIETGKARLKLGTRAASVIDPTAPKNPAAPGAVVPDLQ